MRPLEIIVCLKPVPDPTRWGDINLDPVTKSIRREGISQVINPLDRHALEAALALREAYGAKITTLTMGPPGTAALLQEALALGADEALLLCDPIFAGSDTLATSRVLASAAQKVATWDLILLGQKSLDGSTAQVGPQLAVHLGIPHVTSVSSIIRENDTYFLLDMELENGLLTLHSPLPLVLTVTAKLNNPRTATLMGIIEARQKNITQLNCADLGLKASLVGIKGSPTRARDVFFPLTERRGKMIQGSASESGRELLDHLGKMGAGGVR